jgi:GxxExxY protein
MKALDDITDAIIDCGIQIHKRFGPGLFELFYEVLLAHALRKRGFKVERQKPISFEYDGVFFKEVFRCDLLVDDEVIVELKSIEALAPVHSKKLLTYLRVADKRVGLLMNFGQETLKEGIRRVVNGFPRCSPSRLRVNHGPAESPIDAEHQRNAR